jgi:hypothetical protein
MPSKKYFFTARTFLSCAFALMASGIGHAGEVLVTGEFRPNVLDPTNSGFINTTPPGLYCTWAANVCNEKDIYMFDLPFTLTKNYTKGGDVRRRWYVGMPASQVVTLISESGGTANITVAFASYSGHVSPGTSANPAFTRGVYGGCIYAHTAGHSQWVRFGWIVTNQISPSPCYSQGDGEEPGYTEEYYASNLGVGLKIDAESPLSLRNGVYEGSLVYTIGGLGKQLDFGDDAVVSDDTLMLRFRFTVEHDLKIDFPAGADRVVLVPEGGWSGWIDHGRLPTRLTKDLPFSLSSSAPFAVTLECQYPQPNGDCGLRNTTAPEAPEVPVHVAITMPGFREAQRNLDALNLKLSTQGLAPRFISDAYAANRASRLHFDVSDEHVRNILDHPGNQYRGNVMVVFDAQP